MVEITFVIIGLVVIGVGVVIFANRNNGTPHRDNAILQGTSPVGETNETPDSLVGLAVGCWLMGLISIAVGVDPIVQFFN